jgi:DNA-binding MarR family transcriptional regulator
MQNEAKIAKRLLEIIPLSMARVRAEMRSCIPGDLSVPHFRILGSIIRGRTLINEIAQHHGVSQPSMSRSVETLVRRGLIERSHDAADRRQFPLRLTKMGIALFNKIKTAAENRLSKKVSMLDSKSRKALLQGLNELEGLFSIGNKVVHASSKGKKV